LELSKSSSFFTREISGDLQNLSDQQKLELLRKFWPNSGLSIKDGCEESFDTYFQYVGQQLSSLHAHPAKFAAQDFEETTNLIQILMDNRSKNRKQVVDVVKKSFLNVEDVAVIRSAELTLRLWLTMNIHSPTTAVGPIQAGDTALEWFDGESLDDLVKRQFKESALPLSTSKAESRIDSALTAAYLFSVCGVTIDWTDNLVDHLRLDRKRRVLTIYRHKICLLNHAKSLLPPIIPRPILEEAIDTLNLLFPFGDGQTRALLLEKESHFTV